MFIGTWLLLSNRLLPLEYAASTRFVARALFIAAHGTSARATFFFFGGLSGHVFVFVDPVAKVSVFVTRYSSINDDC